MCIDIYTWQLASTLYESGIKYFNIWGCVLNSTTIKSVGMGKTSWLVIINWRTKKTSFLWPIFPFYAVFSCLLFSKYFALSFFLLRAFSVLSYERKVQLLEWEQRLVLVLRRYVYVYSHIFTCDNNKWCG